MTEQQNKIYIEGVKEVLKHKEIIGTISKEFALEAFEIMLKALEEKDKEIAKLTAESTEFESKVYKLQERIKEYEDINERV